MSAFPFQLQRARLAVLLLLCLCVAAAVSQSVSIPGTTAVGAVAPTAQALSISLPHGGTIGSARALTQGIAGADFSIASPGTCTAGSSFLPRQNCSLNVAFAPTAPGERRGAIVLLDAAGAPLATELVVGRATGSVGVFVPGTISTVAGDELWIYGGDGNLATQSAIFLPFGFAVDTAGNLFLADSSNNRIRRVDAVTGLISTIAGTGVIGSTGDGGLATFATLSNPSSIALDPAGNLYFSDSGNNTVRRIDAFTGILTTVAGTLNAHGDTGDLGPATSATLNTPNGIAFDSAGNLYIADTGNHVIRRVDTAGMISTVAGRGFATFSGDGGPAVSAGLSSPWSVTPDAAGNLYIADQNNNRIRRIDIAGNIATIAGNGVAAFAGDAGLAAAASLNVPASVAIDVAGNLYVADSGNNRVRKISSKTGLISTIAGNAGESMSGDDGPADQAGLYGPYTLALDNTGSLLIADVFHNRIRRVSANVANLAFPPMRVGRVSSPLPQTLENDGNAALDLLKLDPTSQSQLDPSAATTCSPSAPLAPLDTCVASLQFAPTSTGDKVRGLFNLVSDAGNSPGAVNLTGQVLNVDPATVTLVSSLNPSTTGAAVTFSVTVSSDGSTPTGLVTLLDGTTSIATAQLGAGGLASFNLSTLTGGQHSLTCAYAGDSSNSSAVSPVILQIVKDAQAATGTFLTSSASPIDSGATLRLTATVSVVTAGSGVGAITGTVAFKEGANTLGTADITNGQATLPLSNLAPGTHTILASYKGSSTYAASTSPAITQVVVLATTKLALTSSANPSVAGSPLGLTATILSTGGTPAGAVTFMDGAQLLGTATLNGQGIATLAVAGPIWTPGTHTLAAIYAGDTLDAGTSSATVSESIIIAQPTIAVISSANPSPLSGPVTFTATLASPGSMPTGTLHFFSDAADLGAATVNAAGVASLTASTLLVGDHHITAAYPGDPYNAAASSAPLVESIVATTDAVSISPSNDPALFGTPVTFTMLVTGTGATPTGSVTLEEGSVVLASAPLDATGAASLTLSNLPIGTHILSATYTGDASHAVVVSPKLIERIIQATTLTLAASPGHSIAGTPVTFTLAISGAQGKPISGPITLSDGASTLATLDSAGPMTFTTSTLAVGSHTLTASYAGDSTNVASNANSAVETVEIASTTTTLAANLNPADAGAAVTFTSSVQGNGGALTGSVTFRDGTLTLSSVPLAGSSASLTLSTLAPGLHSITAVYSGDAFDAPSASATLTEQIARRTSVTLLSSANPSLLTDAVTLTLTAANGSATPPTGSIVLSDGGQTIATLALTAGSATYILHNPALGQHTLLASYLGDNENAPASSQPLLQTVTLRPSTTALSASSTALSAGQQLILISVVQASGPNPPTGAVTFSSGSQTLGTAAISSAGVATLTLTPAQALLTVTARYAGDSLYATSVSAIVNITVGPPVEFNLSATPTTVTLKSGDRTTLTLGIVTAPTFSDTLALGCAGLPAYATCTFSENQIAAAGGLPHTLTVTLDTGNPLGAGASAAVVQPRGTTHSPVNFCILPAIIFLAFFHPKKRPGKPLRPRKLLALLLTLGALGTVGMLSGCGSSFTQRATPAGDYTFQIVATGNHTAATNTATVALKVTQ